MLHHFMPASLTELSFEATQCTYIYIVHVELLFALELEGKLQSRNSKIIGGPEEY